MACWKSDKKSLDRQSDRRTRSRTEDLVTVTDIQFSTVWCNSHSPVQYYLYRSPSKTHRWCFRHGFRPRHLRFSIHPPSLDLIHNTELIQYGRSSCSVTLHVLYSARVSSSKHNRLRERRTQLMTGVRCYITLPRLGRSALSIMLSICCNHLAATRDHVSSRNVGVSTDGMKPVRS